MNLPNALTLIRILLIPLFLYEVLKGQFTFAAAVYLAAAFTDALDGAIARMFQMQTALGAFLDPVADKLLVTTSYLSLAFLKLIPLWLVITVISRDVIIVAGSMAVYFLKESLEIRPHPVSKITTFFQIATIFCCGCPLFFIPGMGLRRHMDANGRSGSVHPHRQDRG